jgi:multiple sugar transport system substrate-binding protein
MLSTPVGASTIDGTLHGMPIFTDANALYYRTDLLEQAGLDPESPPETFTEVINMAQTVKEEVDQDLNGYIWQGSAAEGLTIMWLNWLWGMGGRVQNENGTLNVNTEKGIKALQHAKDLIYEHEVTPESVTSEGTDGSRKTFQKGNTVFMRNWPYAYSLFQDDTPVTDKFAVAAMPKHEDYPNANNSCLGGWNAFINVNSKNKSATQAMASQMASIEAQEAIAAKHSKLPVRSELYEDGYWSDSEFDKPESLDIFADALRQTRARPAAAKYSAFSSTLYTECNKALKQEKSVEKALNDAQATIDSEINNA